MAGIVCEQCKISNPVDRITCVNCGAALPVIKPVVSKTAAPKPKPPPPAPVPDDPDQRDFLLYAQYGILPGRPARISGYAMLLGLGAILVMGAAVARVLSGFVVETYGSVLPLIGIAATGVVALMAAVGLWKMQNRGRLLVLTLQLIWVGAAVVLVYGAFNTFPRALRGEFFGRYTFTETTVTTAVYLVVLILAPTLLGLYLLRYWSFTWLLMGGLGTVISSLLLVVVGIVIVAGGMWMFVAAPIVLFNPSLFSLVDPDMPLPGLLRLGFVVSVPINLLAVIGLVIERPRFR